MPLPEISPVEDNPEKLRIMLDGMKLVTRYEQAFARGITSVPFASAEPFALAELAASYNLELQLGYTLVNQMITELGGIRYTAVNPQTRQRNTVLLVDWNGDAPEMPGYQLWLDRVGANRPVKQYVPISNEIIDQLGNLLPQTVQKIA